MTQKTGNLIGINCFLPMFDRPYAHTGTSSAPLHILNTQPFSITAKQCDLLWWKLTFTHTHIGSMMYLYNTANHNRCHSAAAGQRPCNKPHSGQLNSIKATPPIKDELLPTVSISCCSGPLLSHKASKCDVVLYVKVKHTVTTNKRLAYCYWAFSARHFSPSTSL